jgi:hypothetical protein
MAKRSIDRRVGRDENATSRVDFLDSEEELRSDHHSGDL